MQGRTYGITEIREKEKSRDHTENLLKKNSQSIKVINGKERKIKIFGKTHLNPVDINVPGDPSSAAFFSALTLLNKGSSIKIKNVGLNPTRIGFYKILKSRGAKIKFKNLKKKNNEMSGDIFVLSSKIKPIRASKKYYVNSTDEYPILFIIAALTEGISIFEGSKILQTRKVTG